MPNSSSPPTLASLQKRAKDLLTLARNPSTEARATLASGLYDLSRASADLPSEERTLAADIVLEIFKSAAPSVRRQLSERVALDPQAPKSLILALAHDEIAIAFPVLIESPVLDEADLLDVLRTSPPEHRLGLLQRETLSEAVAAAVVDARDPQTMRWLIENLGAKIPLPAMETLVEASRAETGLQQPLVNRSDLPPALAAKMYAFVPDDLRHQLVAQHKLKPSAQALGAVAPAPGKTSSPAADARALAVAQELRRTGALTIDLLVKTIRAGKIIEFEAMLARFSHISLAASRQILSSPTGEALAVVLKAQGVAKGTFATIFILTRKAREPGTDLSTALARASDAFDRLTSDEAKKRFAALRDAQPEDPAA